MPSIQDVPDSMAALTQRNAFQLSDNRYRSDIDRLIGAMKTVATEKRERAARETGERQARQHEADKSQPPGSPRALYWFSLPAVLAVAAAIFYLASQRGLSNGNPATHTGTPSLTKTITSRHQQGFHAQFTRSINASLSGPRFENPIFAHNAPDPMVIAVGDKFYAYTTQSSYSTYYHLPVLVSQDLVGWHALGDALPKLPAWADTSSHGDTWGPDPVRLHARFYLYFAERLQSTGSMGIALATSKTPRGPFHVQGQPLKDGTGFTTIGPFVLKEPKTARLLMYWGSGRQPIWVQPLSKDGRSLVGQAQVALTPSTATPYDDLVEGVDVVRHGRFYYLFYSGDSCCLPNPHYAVLVARSRSPLGPFTRAPMNPIVKENRQFIAPGGGTVFTDHSGAWFIVYHAMPRSDRTGERFLMLDRILWKGGWPVVNSGNGPSSTPQPRPQIASKN